MRFTLDQLRAFVQVATDHSFTTAARTLRIPRSTVSRLIASLEEALDARLVERTTRQVRLTDAGTELLERARRVLGDVDAMPGAVAERQGRLSGAIRLSAPVELGMVLLARPIAEFLAQNPEVTIDVDLTGRRADLLDDPVDLAIRMGAVPDGFVRARPLTVIPHGFYASRGYLETHPVPTEALDLAAHAGLQFVAEDGTWTLSRRGSAVQVTPRTVLLRANAYAVLQAGCRAHLGVARLPVIFAEPDPALVRLLPDWTALEVPVHAVYLSERSVARRVRALVDHLVDALSV